jgi:hypothetical protein
VATGTTPAPSPTIDLTKVDWQTVTIPGSWFKDPGNVTLHASSSPGSGEADNVQTQIASPQGGGPEVETVYADSGNVVYGTLDGTPMAALAVQVQAGGTADSVRVYSWVVYSGGPSNLTVVGVITAKSGLPNEWSPNPTQAPNVTLLPHFAFEGSEIVANEAYYKANDPTAGPSGRAITTWALQRGTLVSTGTQILQ